MKSAFINLNTLLKGSALLLYIAVLIACNAQDSNTEIYENSFTKSPIGIYTQDQLNKEWDTPPYENGLTEKRVTIIEDTHQDKMMQVFYPKNEYGIDDTGAQWKLEFSKSYDELYLSYRLKFGANFDFIKGGKLPGLAGGTAPSGGKEVTGTNGWSGRMMWRTDGRIVQYVYHPDMPDTYGEDFPWNIGGEHFFEPEVWYNIQNHFVMNTPGENDGVMQAWLNGELVLDRHDMRFRDVDSFGIDLLYFSTFFGGGDQDWAASKDETILFDDFKISKEKILQ
ncbi:MAG: hypothetical protein U9R50_04785 [Campylobacterota bacterium]|nr:hypothetical protein [Campylobacterota bacterium]